MNEENQVIQPEDSTNQTTDTQAESSEAQRLATELAEYKDRLLRTAAELENMRRRFEKEKADLLKFGQERLFLDFLPALDSLDRALPENEADQKSETNDSYLEGMRMVKRQILEVFTKHGLSPVVGKGAAFDPNIHQAIQREPSNEVEVDTVKEEYAKGYLLHGRLLRAAMVSVLTPSVGQ